MARLPEKHKIIISVPSGRADEDVTISVDGHEISDRVRSWSAHGDRHQQSVTFELIADDLNIEVETRGL